MNFYKTTTALILFSLSIYLIQLAFQIELSGNETDTLRVNKSIMKTQDKNDLTTFKMKMHFEPNLGQVDESVQFISRGKGYNLFLASNEAVLSLQRSRDYEKDELPSSVVKMRFEGANPNLQICGHDELSGKTNYFLGNKSDKWLTNIPNYGKVKYENVYNGIDLIYYGNETQLEYDFLVSPNGNPKDILLHFDAHEKPKIDKQGNLVFIDKDQKLFMKPPVAYQTRKDAREIIEAKYAYLGKDMFGFDIGEYDTEIPLVIDPVIIFSTYLGNNSSSASAQAVAVDSAGNVYITGATGSNKFPTTHKNLVPNFTGPAHVFITKVNAEGTELIYSTYFGGHNDDVPWGIAVDNAGNILVAGRSLSNDFPTVNALQTKFKGEGELAGDGFIVKVDPEGDQIVYSTYMGGDWDDEARDIAVDKAGNAFVTGITTSPGEFPYKNPLPSSTCDDTYHKGFVMKFDPSGNLEFSTCLGGEKNGAEGYGIATDREDNVYVTGETYVGFPTTSGAYRSTGNGVFVTKLNNTGTSVIYSTYISGTQYEHMGRGESIVVDTMGNAYIAGRCTHADFPMVNAFQPSHANSGSFNDDGFVAKLSSDGSSLLFSSFIGGDHNDYSLDIDLDKKGNIYVSGITQSDNFPTVEPLQSSLNGHNDVFIAMIDGENYSLAFSTYFGGSGWEGGDKAGLAVSPDGYVFVAGRTTSTDFPTENAYQETTTTVDAFVLKLLIIEKGILKVSPDPVVFPLTEIGQTSKESVELSNSGIGALEIKKMEVEPTSSYTIENKPDLPYNLDPGKKVEFKIAYSPTSSTSGRTNSSGAGTITIESDAEEPVTKVSLVPGLVVNKTGDESDADISDGVCDIDLTEPGAQVTLRAAIEHVNYTKSNEVTIVLFDVPGEEVPILQSKGPLPEIEYPISLDASKQQRGYVVLDGINAGKKTKGLVISAGESTVKAMNIMNFGSVGVYLKNNGKNTIDDCVILKNGAIGVGSVGWGLYIENSGFNEISNNVISGNNYGGIWIGGEYASYNIIKRNKIGTGVNEFDNLPNFGYGIRMTDRCQNNIIEKNFISFNLDDGISISNHANNNFISANIITANGQFGIIINYGKAVSGLNPNTIDNNTISGNGIDGIFVGEVSHGTVISKNIIGSDSTGTIDIGNGRHGINIGHSNDVKLQYNTLVYNKGAGVNIANKPDYWIDIYNNYIGVNKKVSDLDDRKNLMAGIILKSGRVYAVSNQIANHNPVGVQVLGGWIRMEENSIFNNKTGLDINKITNLGPPVSYNIIRNTFEGNESGITIEGKVVFITDEPSYENIQANTIWNNSGSNTGIHLKNARARIRGNLLYANQGNAITVEGESEVTVDLNNIIENQEFGLENLNLSNTVNALYNYWNDSTGPGGSGPGLGDKVSDGVDYSEWMTEFISVFVAAENDTVLAPIGKNDSLTLVFENWVQLTDYLNVTVDDDLGWVQNYSPFQVPIPYYPHELSQLYLTIPASVTDSTFNKVQMSATSTTDPNDSFSTSFTILAVEPAAILFEISPDTIAMEVGDSVQFEVTGYDQFYNPIDTVDWSCTGGIVDDAGLFIAGNNNGSFTVTVEEWVSGLSAVALIEISGAVPTGMEIARNPNADELLYNYPNPFYHSTTIKYKLQSPGNISLRIFDISGKEVAILADANKKAGNHEVTWQPKGIPGGIYFSRIEVGDSKLNSKEKLTQTRKLIFIK